MTGSRAVQQTQDEKQFEPTTTESLKRNLDIAVYEWHDALNRIEQTKADLKRQKTLLKKLNRVTSKLLKECVDRDESDDFINEEISDTANVMQEGYRNLADLFSRLKKQNAELERATWDFHQLTAMSRLQPVYAQPKTEEYDAVLPSSPSSTAAHLSEADLVQIRDSVAALEEDESDLNPDYIAFEVDDESRHDGGHTPSPTRVASPYSPTLWSTPKENEEPQSSDEMEQASLLHP